jgi:hypothetical protein
LLSGFITIVGGVHIILVSELWFSDKFCLSFIFHSIFCSLLCQKKKKKQKQKPKQKQNKTKKKKREESAEFQ